MCIKNQYILCTFILFLMHTVPDTYLYCKFHNLNFIVSIITYYTSTEYHTHYYNYSMWLKCKKNLKKFDKKNVIIQLILVLF